MNGKVSTNEIMAIATGSMFAMFPGFANVLILSQSNNASLLALLIGFVIGLIPIFIIMFISKKMNTSLYQFLKDKFSFFGNILYIILLLMALFICFLSSWLMIDFIISQFLTRNSYYLIALIGSPIVAIGINKGFEVVSRTIFILFIISIITLTILGLFLIPYVDISNLKPYIDVPFKDIIKSSFTFISLGIIPIIYVLGLKSKVVDKEKFQKKLLYSYIIVSFIIFTFTFLIITVYGIDLAKILTYPAYALFKKVQVFGFIERIENISAFVFITEFFAQFSHLIYILKDGICLLFKFNNKKKVSIMVYLFAILIPCISIYLFKTYDLISYLKYSPYIVSIIYLVVIIIFIRCLFIKKA